MVKCEIVGTDVNVEIKGKIAIAEAMFLMRRIAELQEEETGTDWRTCLHNMVQVMTLPDELANEDDIISTAVQCTVDDVKLEFV